MASAELVFIRQAAESLAYRWFSILLADASSFI
jgi:hypothetical protein